MSPGHDVAHEVVGKEQDFNLQLDDGWRAAPDELVPERRLDIPERNLDLPSPEIPRQYRIPGVLHGVNEGRDDDDVLVAESAHANLRGDDAYGDSLWEAVHPLLVDRMGVGVPGLRQVREAVSFAQDGVVVQRLPAPVLPPEDAVGLPFGENCERRERTEGTVADLQVALAKVRLGRDEETEVVSVPRRRDEHLGSAADKRMRDHGPDHGKAASGLLPRRVWPFGAVRIAVVCLEGRPVKGVDVPETVERAKPNGLVGQLAGHLLHRFDPDAPAGLAEGGRGRRRLAPELDLHAPDRLLARCVPPHGLGEHQPDRGSLVKEPMPLVRAGGDACECVVAGVHDFAPRRVHETEG